MIEHLARRGLHHAFSGMGMLRRTTSEVEVEMPNWGVGLLISFFVVFVLFLSAVC